MPKNDKKKILIVTAFPTQGAGSGALITTQAKSYIEQGHEVVIITANNRTNFDKIDGVKYHLVPFKGESENPEKIEGQCDFNFLMFTTHTESTANFWNINLEQLEEYMKMFDTAIAQEVKEFNPDVIHTQHNWISSSIATKFKKPITLTIHGTDLMGYRKAMEKLQGVEEELNAVKEQKNIKKKEIAKLEEIYKRYSSKKRVLQDIKTAMNNGEITMNKAELEELVDILDRKTIYNLYISNAKNSANKSNQIIVISEAQRQEFCELFPENAKKVVLLENGYDPKTFYKDDNVQREDVVPEDLRNYDDLVLFVGKFADFKGIDALLNAAKIYETDAAERGKIIETILIGSGVLDEKLRNQADVLGLEHTHFLGRKGHEEICKYQNLATVSLIPSRNEPFGLVVIEGTACGHPVIATNAGGIPGIVNTERKDISDEYETYTTPLGILVPPLPERPSSLTDKQKDELDGYMTQYMLLPDKDKKQAVDEMGVKLGIKKSEIEKYVSSYQRTVNKISDSVQAITENEILFDDNYIANYTNDNYSQEKITEKLMDIFDNSIADYNRSLED